MQGDMMESINLFCSFHLLKPSDFIFKSFELIQYFLKRRERYVKNKSSAIQSVQQSLYILQNLFSSVSQLIF